MRRATRSSRRSPVSARAHQLGAGWLVAMTAALCGATRVVAPTATRGPALVSRPFWPPTPRNAGPCRRPALGGGHGRTAKNSFVDAVLGADVTYNPANADALAALVAHRP